MNEELSGLSWIDSRIRERSELRHKRLREKIIPGAVRIDASKFSAPLSDLAIAMTYKIEREGQAALGRSSIPVDIAAILRQVTQTYGLIRFVNGDETRRDNPAYRTAYSFVILPLIRTMIDGFYNITTMLVDPSSARRFRISGYFRLREALRQDEARYSNDPAWISYLTLRRQVYEDAVQSEGITDADIDVKANEWPLLGKYLKTHPDSMHKQMLRKFTLGFWKEYSSVSHASYDGLVSTFAFINADRVPRDRKADAADASERHLAMHVGRAAGLLLCLLTELQHFCKFPDANIDQRLADIWGAIIVIYEIRELYESRYKAMLRIPVTEAS